MRRVTRYLEVHALEKSKYFPLSLWRNRGLAYVGQDETPATSVQGSRRVTCALAATMYRIDFYRGIDSVINIARSDGPRQLPAFTRYVLVSLSDRLHQEAGFCVSE